MNVSSTSLPDGVDDGAQRCVEETSMNVSSTSLPDGVDDGAQRCVGETSMNVSSTLLPDGVDDGAQLCAEETSMNAPSTLHSNGVDDGPQLRVGETSINAPSTLLSDGVDDGSQLRVEEAIVNVPSTLHHDGVGDGPQPQVEETVVDVSTTLHQERVDETHAEAPQAQTSGDERQVPRIDPQEAPEAEASSPVLQTIVATAQGWTPRLRHVSGATRSSEADAPPPVLQPTTASAVATDSPTEEVATGQWCLNGGRWVPRLRHVSGAAGSSEAEAPPPIAAEETIATMPTLQGHDGVQARKAQKQVFKGRKRNEKGFWSRPSNDDDDTSHENLQVCSVGGNACSVGGAPPRTLLANPRPGAATLADLWDEGLRSSTHLRRAWYLFCELLVLQGQYSTLPLEVLRQGDFTVVLSFFDYVGRRGARAADGVPPALLKGGAPNQVDAGGD